MNNRNIFLINILTLFIVVITLLKALYITITLHKDFPKLFFKNFWILPILTIAVYIILTYLIKHPKYLIKKNFV